MTSPFAVARDGDAACFQITLGNLVSVSVLDGSWEYLDEISIDVVCAGRHWINISQLNTRRVNCTISQHNTLAAWRSGNVVCRMIEVTPRWAAEVGDGRPSSGRYTTSVCNQAN